MTPSFVRDVDCGMAKILEKSYMVTLCCKHTMAITFEKFCQAECRLDSGQVPDMLIGEALTGHWRCGWRVGETRREGEG